MNSDHKRDTLRRIELFQQLNDEEFEALLDIMGEETYEKGGIICAAGDIGEEAYVILEGEIEIFAVKDQEEKFLTRLGPGEFCGEMCLLMGSERTATMKAAQLTKLLVISKESFTRFLTNNKALSYLVRKLSKRLEDTSIGRVIEEKTIPIAVAGDPDLKGKELVAAALSRLLAAMTRKTVLLVEVESVSGENEGDAPLLRYLKEQEPEKIGSYIRPESGGVSVLPLSVLRDTSITDYGNYLSELVNDLHRGFNFGYIVFRLGSDPRRGVQSMTPPHLVDAASRFANVLVRISAGDDYARQDTETQSYGNHPRVFHVLLEGNPRTRRIPINACEPFFIPADGRLEGTLKRLKPEHYQLRRANPRIRQPAPQEAKPFSPGLVPLERLARKIQGKTVGLALGGGAAFGISHLGVLQFFEEHNIPIDLLAGCSIGSMVASGYAAGVSVQKLIDMAHQLGGTDRLLNVLDWTLSKPGFIAGDRIKDIFEPYLEQRRYFDDLIWPLRVCATDIRNGARVDIGNGRLADAFRASSSVPVVITPYEIDVAVNAGGDGGTQRHVLVDGGVVEPVPVDVVRKMGADIVIAVNVVPKLKEGVELPWAPYIRTASNLVNPLNYFSRNQALPNAFDTSMLSLQTLQHELGNLKMYDADVSIQPDLSDFTWIEFYRSAELVETGYRALFDHSEESPDKTVWKAIHDLLAVGDAQEED